MTTNIPSYIEDPTYRYKMPRMVVKQESRLNGVKTNLFNIDDIAKALRVPAEYLMKFMCAELATSKEKSSILKGSHSTDSLVRMLDKFIEKFLLCSKCKLPETSFEDNKKKLQSKCRACGFTTNHDSAHKVSTYIMKNLPKKDMGEMKESDVKGGKEGKKARK